MRKIQVAAMMSILLTGISVKGFAQQTETQPDDEEKRKQEQRQALHREMTLEREYNPIVQDAAKVNTLPVVREMNIIKRPIVFADYTIPLMPEKEINILPAGALMTDVFHTKRNGYVHFGGGMHMNLMGDLGYHVLNTDRDQLGISFSHRSTNGNVAFKKEWEAEKRKAKLNDNIGGLDYKHRFDKADFRLGAKFGYSAFNYYGMPSNLPTIMTDDFVEGGSYTVSSDSTTNQGNRLIQAYGSISATRETSIGYRVGVNFTNFNQKYSLHKDFDGMNENHLAVDLGLNSPVKNGRCFGVDLKVNILSYSAPKVPFDAIADSLNAYDTHFNATFSPYFRINRDRWKLKLGVNGMLVSQNGNTDALLSPNILFETSIAKWSVFYTDLGGGVESNSMATISRVNRYINPTFAPDASKSWADLQIGVRSAAAAGLWFDVFAGYKYTESDLFFNPSSRLWYYHGFNNVSMAFQPKTQRIQAGATLKYDYREIVDFYLQGVYNYYNFTYEDNWKNGLAGIRVVNNDELEAYGKPTFTANAGIRVRPIKPLIVSLDYSMMTGAYAQVDSKNVKMDAINDLRLRTAWNFSDMFSVYAQFNNLTFGKQELYYGYPLWPFSAMAGLCFNF
jgi:hypothetical protein